MQVDQSLFNILVTVAAFLGGWVLNTVWHSVKELQKADKELADKVASVEVLVAGKYMTRDEFNTAMNGVMSKLDLIAERLANKADRP